MENRISTGQTRNAINTNPLSLTNFVGNVVGFFNVCIIRFRRLLLAASLSFESEMIY